MASPYAVRDAIRDNLAADGTLSGLCGDRFFGIWADDVDQLPFVTLRIDNTADGQATNRTIFPEMELAISIYSSDRTQTRTIAERIEELVLAYAGPVGAVRITSANIITREEIREPDVDAFSVTIRVLCKHA